MKLIIDTDIGNDCDDAGALAIMHHLKSVYPFDIATILSSTAYIEGAYSIELINQYYGNSCPIGQNFKKKRSMVSSSSLYTIKLCQNSQIGEHGLIEDYVKRLRKAYVETKEKIDFIILGPMNALYDFFLSTADEISPLTGLELFNQKTQHVYVMGGTFLENPIYYANQFVISEWNIKLDVCAAQYFIQQVTCEITFVPFECGLFLTGKNLFLNPNNPVTKCYEYYCHGLRESWDLVTMYYAISKDNRFFKCSNSGTITIDEKGITRFKEEKMGKHYVLSIQNSNQLQETIDQYLY